MRIIVECATGFDAKLIQLIVNAVEMVAKLVGVEITTTLEADPLPQQKHRGRGRGPTVRYAVIAADDAARNDILAALGRDTIGGVLYSHLINHGPCTEKEIRESTKWGRKTVESELHRLKHRGVVVAVPITDGSVLSNEDVGSTEE
jgi:hypothetical protein